MKSWDGDLTRNSEAGWYLPSMLVLSVIPYNMQRTTIIVIV